MDITSKKLEEVIYFLIDTTTRSMRRYTHDKLRKGGVGLTLDQFVLMKLIEENSGINQVDMAKRLFKDNASVTRTIELLVDKKFLKRSLGTADRRSYDLELSVEGRNELLRCKPLVFEIRKKGIEGIDDKDLETTLKTLERIKSNF